jgi:septal ring factor EnvC (AmiA/AmiB activator)
MPRTKGSKNKPKTVTADFATQLAEKQSAKEALTAEIASITANIDTLKADLKAKKAALKKAEKEVATLVANAKAAEEAKKAEAESVLKKLLAEGMSADEILAKLK